MKAPSYVQVKEERVFIILFILLLLAWIFGWILFHVAGAFIHILLILAVISLIVHFVRGPRTA